MIESDSVHNKEITFTKHWSFYLINKRIFDIVISLVALLLSSPVYLVVWIINKFSKSNRGPLLYKQVRMGQYGRKFGMYKFRSMVVGAEEKLKNNEELYKRYVENNYKLKPNEDPRITRFGRFLRKSSIDEIPQFINILKGDMSLVGPRPVIEEELKEYDSYKLLSVKPGAMGLWQAVGRSQIGYPERANIEMRYIDKASVLLDLKIIFGNFVNIFKGDGAY
ncbi:sugar transferase [Companilactobacillus farciminis]|uniref:sugar transferase n=1 Tax=Companilactobacillus farciminis TaxID=1612 RepID=UPI00232E8A64|nr:sugar transferase [Companilactobacillus farciminis]WCG35995.1 sugar transferase [Companilactobacillus farciminis]